ncbi:hypothetical protein ACLKA6_013827 [Drosophila palustris]
MSGIYLLATILCLVLGSALGQQQPVLEGGYNVTQVCTMVKTGTQLGSSESCDYYYVCTKQGPVKQSCSSGYAYNFRTQTCAPASQVECYYGMSNPCAGKAGVCWVPDVKNPCVGWIYCANGNIAGQGSCAKGEKFDSANQRCNYGSCVSDNIQSGPNQVDYCSVVPPGIYFGSPSDCKEWYYCSPSTGNLETGYCASSAYIVSSGSCGYDTAPGACDRVVSVPVPTSCSRVGQTQGDPITCGNYYWCNGQTFELKQCAYGNYYDTTTENCVTRQTAVATPGCNRCQYATTSFVNAVDSNKCNTYYYCRNGNNGDVTTCPVNLFFNEADQACAPAAQLPNYVSKNGACYGATVDGSSTTPGDGSSSTTDPSSTTLVDSTTTTEMSTTPEKTTTVETTEKVGG